MIEERGAEPRQLVEHFFRHESARLVASLARAFGTRYLDLIEDVVQTALLRALSSWSLKGIPPDPTAWLFRVARNLAIDALRRDLRWGSLTQQADPVAVETQFLNDFPADLDDDLLRMIFVCCDDAIPAESQVALALKTLCGFDVCEIAHALLTTEANVARRISRAKEKLRSAAHDLASVTPELIHERLPAVHAVIYLLFNEGYSSTQTDRLIREDLCQEAIHLALLLAEHPFTRSPDASAFLALLLFHASRFEARLDGAGSLLLLEDQDRSQWDARLIAEGFRWFAQSASGNRASRYHAEAWIAAEHCRARSFRETEWDRIVQAYDLLVTLAPSPIHELNRAIAIAERDGAEAGWTAFEAIDRARIPEQYHLWAATAGELARRRGAVADARRFFKQALQAVPTNVERRLLTERLASLGDG